MINNRKKKANNNNNNKASQRSPIKTKQGNYGLITMSQTLMMLNAYTALRMHACRGETGHQIFF